MMGLIAQVPTVMKKSKINEQKIELGFNMVMKMLAIMRIMTIHHLPHPSFGNGAISSNNGIHTKHNTQKKRFKLCTKN